MATNDELNDRLFEVQKAYAEDMRDFAHQFMKLSTDLINMQFGHMQPPQESPPQEEDEPIEGLDPSMTGGELSA